MNKQLFFLLPLMLFYRDALGQVDSSNRKAVKLSKEHLTYMWTGRYCPPLANTEYHYGFKIKCAGCILTREIKRHNSKVKRKINRVYGINWFDKHRNAFIN